MGHFQIDTPDSFRLFYSRYYKAMMLYALKLTGDENTAEDIVQNCFLKVWEKREDFKDESTVRSYLYLSIRQRTIDQARHAKVEEKYKNFVLGENEACDKGWEEQEAFNNEMYRRLFDAINELPPRQREIFLQYMKGKKNAEIAQAMNITEETIRVQRKRALKTLRKKIGEKEMIFLLLFVNV